MELNKVEIWDGNAANAQALRQAGAFAALPSQISTLFSSIFLLFCE
jgi:hypothetical protein